MGSMVEADYGGRPAECHVKSDFGSIKVAAATVIIQAWQERGEVGHGGRRVRQVMGGNIVDGKH